MHFGLFMMPLHPSHRSLPGSYRRDVAQIVLADQLGFQEAWVAEHLTERWENARAPDLLLARARAVLGRNYERHQRPNRLGTVQMTSTKLDPAMPFGTRLAITTDSDDAGWDHESLRLLMERVALRVAHLG
jgi:hypothetical protein